MKFAMEKRWEAWNGQNLEKTKNILYINDNPGESFGLKFIPNQSDLFRFIPKSVSAPIQTHPSQSEKSFQSRLM